MTHRDYEHAIGITSDSQELLALAAGAVRIMSSNKECGLFKVRVFSKKVDEQSISCDGHTHSYFVLGFTDYHIINPIFLIFRPAVKAFLRNQCDSMSREISDRIDKAQEVRP